MSSNARMANRQVDVDLRLSLRPQLALWLGLAWLRSRIPGKDLALPSSYRAICLDTNGKFFEKIPLTRILYEASERGLMQDEKFGFLPRHSTSLQLARLVERITRNSGEKRLTGTVFLDVTKAFDTV